MAREVVAEPWNFRTHGSEGCEASAHWLRGRSPPFPGARSSGSMSKRQHSKDAERIAGMGRGGPWRAAVGEARGPLRLAEGSGFMERRGLNVAAPLFTSAVRPRHLNSSGTGSGRRVPRTQRSDAGITLVRGWLSKKRRRRSWKAQGLLDARRPHRSVRAPEWYWLRRVSRGRWMVASPQAMRKMRPYRLLRHFPKPTRDKACPEFWP
jgi:hypothetical protein